LCEVDLLQISLDGFCSGNYQLQPSRPGSHGTEIWLSTRYYTKETSSNHKSLLISHTVQRIHCFLSRVSILTPQWRAILI